jgi:UDP-sugar pyrophosphorylase
LGIEYIVLFQDTNALAFHTLPLLLGVSKQHGFIMNSLCVPRKARQAIGGIAKLQNTLTGQERTVNVEYNQLDPLLRATEDFKEGDTNDLSTGYSPFPGNINQLLFKLDAYNMVLERTKGVMPDFVNPKYKDDTKTVFKKPTRLECMMQEFPTVLDPDESKNVGFTQAVASICFSPVKNAVADGVALQAKGTPPGTAASGESDQYAALRIFLRSHGCHIMDARSVIYKGIEVVPGPAIVLKPDFVCCPGDLKSKFPNPEKITITSRSTLIVKGSDVVIHSLELDGCLVVDAAPGEHVSIQHLVVQNDGWVQVPVSDSDTEVMRMRGFKIEHKETERLGANCKYGGRIIADDTSIDDNVPYEVVDVSCGVNIGP